MNRTEKQQLIDELHKELESSPHAVLVDFRGLSVPAATEFRKRMRASGSRYRVVKNSLALRAAKGTALERLERSSRARRASPTPATTRWPSPRSWWTSPRTTRRSP